MSIECLYFHKHESGALLGFADFYIPSFRMEIYGCPLYTRNGKRWVGLPAREYQDKESGEKRFQPIIKFRDKKYHEAFVKAAKTAIDEWCARQQTHKE